MLKYHVGKENAFHSIWLRPWYSQGGQAAASEHLPQTLAYSAMGDGIWDQTVQCPLHTDVFTKRWQSNNKPSKVNRSSYNKTGESNTLPQDSVDQRFLSETYSASFSWLWSWNTFFYCSVAGIGMNPNTCTHISQGSVNPSNNNHLPQNARIHFSIKAESFAKQRKTINTDKNILPSPCAIKSQTNNRLEANGGKSCLFITFIT